MDALVAQFGSVPTGISPLIRASKDPTALAGREVPERDWIVKDLIPSNTVTMIAGDGGVGKTLLTQQLAMCAALGIDWLGREVAPVKTCAVFCEDEDDEIHRRLSDIAISLNVDLGDPRLKDFRYISRNGAENGMVEFIQEFRDGERRQIMKQTTFFYDVYNWALAHGAQLIILDSLHDFFHGNENDRAQTRYFVNQLRWLASEIDGAVILLSHPSMSGMASGTGASGSTAWNNAVRSRLYLTRPKGDDDETPPDPDMRILKTMKANYGRIGDAINLRWANGVFNTDLPMQGGAISSVERMINQRAFLEALKITNAQLRPISEHKASPHYAGKVLKEYPPCAGLTVSQVERAMLDLFTSGKIAKATIGTSPNRHPIISLAPTEKAL